MYRYIKAPVVAAKFRRTPRRKPAIWSFLLMTAGSGLLLWVGWPILSFSLLQDMLQAKTISPVQESGAVLASAMEVVSAPKEFTNANLWFPNAPQKKVVTPVNTYKLSIPKLNINKAAVVIASDDLANNLIHYGGTGLPGDYGNAVIFGHSTLPQFFNPANYKTIFSLLPTLKTGEEFFLEYDGVTYRYLIYDMAVTEPNDLTPLEQKFDDSYVTLVTCVPPGTYWKRLNVRARLVRPEAGE